jgi:hypothetical protein
MNGASESAEMSAMLAAVCETMVTHRRVDDMARKCRAVVILKARRLEIGGYTAQSGITGL